MIDKEAQGKETIIGFLNLITAGECVEDLDTFYEDLIKIMESIGYRKLPKDRPKLRDLDLACLALNIIFYKVPAIAGDESGEWWEAELRDKDIPIKWDKRKGEFIADQILSLIPNELPKDKPPLLSEEEIIELAYGLTSILEFPPEQCSSELKCIAQAQWDIWNKAIYGGEE